MMHQTRITPNTDYTVDFDKNDFVSRWHSLGKIRFSPVVLGFGTAIFGLATGNFIAIGVGVAAFVGGALCEIKCSYPHEVNVPACPGYCQKKPTETRKPRSNTRQLPRSTNSRELKTMGGTTANHDTFSLSLTDNLEMPSKTMAIAMEPLLSKQTPQQVSAKTRQPLLAPILRRM